MTRKRRNWVATVAGVLVSAVALGALPAQAEAADEPSVNITSVRGTVPQLDQARDEWDVAGFAGEPIKILGDIHGRDGAELTLSHVYVERRSPLFDETEHFFAPSAVGDNDWTAEAVVTWATPGVYTVRAEVEFNNGDFVTDERTVTIGCLYSVGRWTIPQRDPQACNNFRPIGKHLP